MDLSKIGRTEQVLGAAGVLLFIFSFFSWYSASVTYLGTTIGGTASAWQGPSGFIDWFPILLLLVYGVVVALPAFGVVINAAVLEKPSNRAFIGLVLSALAVLLFAIQGLTYPSGGFGVSAGPDWAYYVCLIIALAAGAQSYLGFTQQGGSFAEVGAALQARTQAGGAQQQGSATYVEPQQPGSATYGQPQDPQQPPAPPTGS